MFGLVTPVLHGCVCLVSVFVRVRGGLAGHLMWAPRPCTKGVVCQFCW
jgi:hypothetical protein